jgi:hypothetical protein
MTKRHLFEEDKTPLPRRKTDYVSAKIVQHDQRYVVELKFRDAKGHIEESINIPPALLREGGEGVLEKIEKMNQQFLLDISRVPPLAERYHYIKTGEKKEQAAHSRWKNAINDMTEKVVRDMFREYIDGVEIAFRHTDTEKFLRYLETLAKMEDAHIFERIRNQVVKNGPMFPYELNALERNLMEYDTEFARAIDDPYLYLEHKAGMQSRSVVDERSRDQQMREQALLDKAVDGMKKALIVLNDALYKAALEIRGNEYIAKQDATALCAQVVECIEGAQSLYAEFKQATNYLPVSEERLGNDHHLTRSMDSLDAIEMLLEDMRTLAEDKMADPIKLRDAMFDNVKSKRAR